LSAPQIAVQAASPLPQSPASEDESADEDRDGSVVDVVEKTSETPGHVEDWKQEREEDSAKLSGLEMDSEDVKSADDEERPVPDDEEGEPMEGRLSADTSEQIFISQQIEAKTASEQRLLDETRLPDEHVCFDESEHVAVPTDSLDVSSSGRPPADTDRLQSPDKTPIGTCSICEHYHNKIMFERNTETVQCLIEQ